MKKLLIGIIAVALLGLVVMPAMAADGQLAESDTVLVSITVGAYGAIAGLRSLSFDVPGPYVPGIGYGDTFDFTVLCNVPTALVVTADLVTPYRTDPGYSEASYPTATIVDGTGHQIGFGVALTNVETGEYGAWWDDRIEEARVSFAPSLTTHPDLNARIVVNSYMDSARGTDELAPVGVYAAELYLTLYDAR